MATAFLDVGDEHLDLLATLLDGERLGVSLLITCTDATAQSKSNRWRLLKLMKMKWLVLGCMDSYDSNQIVIFAAFFEIYNIFILFALLRSRNFSKKPSKFLAE